MELSHDIFDKAYIVAAESSAGGKSSDELLLGSVSNMDAAYVSVADSILLNLLLLP